MFEMPSAVAWCSKFLFRPHESQMPEKVQAYFEPQRPGPHDCPTFPPPPPGEILARRSEYEDQMHARKSQVPKGVKADTALHTLCRLYEYFVIDRVTGYRQPLYVLVNLSLRWAQTPPQVTRLHRKKMISTFGHTKMGPRSDFVLGRLGESMLVRCIKNHTGDGGPSTY